MYMFEPQPQMKSCPITVTSGTLKAISTNEIPGDGSLQLVQVHITIQDWGGVIHL